MPGCCDREKKPAKVTVKYPDGSTKTYDSRPQAVAAMTRVAGAKITG